MSDAADETAKVAFAERKADELMRHHLEDMEILRKETQVTFTFLIAALSASFGYVLKLYESTKTPFEQNWVWLAPVIALTMHLGLTATYLLLRAMMAVEVQTPGNLPALLIGEAQPKRSLSELRLAEMWGVAERAEKNRRRNTETGRVINLTRRWILLAPITFLAVWTAAVATGA